VKLLTSLLSGLLVGIAAIFLHVFVPPFGILLALLGTFTAIWSLGRCYGSRKYKFVASASWTATFYQAATFGSGKEILVLGDNLGNGFLYSSFIVIFIAVILPAK
jgi:hypothetical protein